MWQVQEETASAMQAAFEKLRDFFHGCDYGPALDAAPRDVLPLYLRAIDHDQPALAMLHPDLALNRLLPRWLLPGPPSAPIRIRLAR